MDIRLKNLSNTGRKSKGNSVYGMGKLGRKKGKI
jgi:hypothetical protein